MSEKKKKCRQITNTLSLSKFSSNGHIVRCPSCRVIASSFRVLFVDEEFCAGGDVSKKLTEQLTTKYNTEMTELKITYGRQITKLEKKSQAQNRKISQLEQENRELRQKFHFASMDGDEAQQKLLQICQVLETEPLRRNRKRTRQN